MLDKHVRFSLSPPEVYILNENDIDNQSRIGQWERFAVDRDRFQKRIKIIERNISWVMCRSHRIKMYKLLNNSDHV
jgi:hypothetical protein